MRTELTPYLMLVALTAMGVRCVAAQAPTDGVFERYDRDANGKVTPQELPNPRTFERFDVNRDGAITQAEYNQVARGAAAGGACQADAAVAAYHREGGGPVPLSANTAFTDLRFSRDWTPGTEDRNGKLMTGTECNYLVAHGSRLYAAISLWNHEPRVEFDLRKHFGGLVGAQEGQMFTTLFAYNEMTPAVHPDTGEPVLLIGGGIMPGLPGDDARAACAWYLVRHADGRYGTGQVFDPQVVPLTVGGLRSARTICVSPFPEDKGRVFYFGGFDAARGPHRDTAWIYRGTLPPVGGVEP